MNFNIILFRPIKTKQKKCWYFIGVGDFIGIGELRRIDICVMFSHPVQGQGMSYLF